MRVEFPQLQVKQSTGSFSSLLVYFLKQLPWPLQLFVPALQASTVEKQRGMRVCLRVVLLVCGFLDGRDGDDVNGPSGAESVKGSSVCCRRFKPALDGTSYEP